MKSFTTLVVMYTVLFVMLDTVPVLPPGFEAVGKQQSNEMAKTLLNVFSKILTAANDRIGRDDELGQTFIKGANSVLSVIRKHLDGEDGEQSASKHEIGQTIIDALSNFLSASIRNTDPNDEMIQTSLNGLKQ